MLLRKLRLALHGYSLTVSLHSRTIPSVWAQRCSALLGAEGNNSDLNQAISKHTSQTNVTCSVTKHTAPFSTERVLHLQLLVKILWKSPWTQFPQTIWKMCHTLQLFIWISAGHWVWFFLMSLALWRSTEKADHRIAGLAGTKVNEEWQYCGQLRLNRLHSLLLAERQWHYIQDKQVRQGSWHYCKKKKFKLWSSFWET